MSILRKLKAALNDDSGAVTVDWVALTASVVIVGGIVVSLVSVGVDLNATKIGNTIVSSASDLSNY
ncbi:MAG: hypothetical protein ACE5FS_00255 [Paracoccaceae bacterium]